MDKYRLKHGTKEWEQAANMLARTHAIILPCPHCGAPVWHHQPYPSRCTWCLSVVPNQDATPTTSPAFTDAQVDAALAILWKPERFACWAESQKVAARPLMREILAAALRKREN